MASSSAAGASDKKYDVFISFRGSDVRRGVLSHLQTALLHQDIEAFVDDQLERGKEISESLLRTIGESRIAIVIFSHNYADSEWCLQELLRIEECRNTTGQIVIPVFYGVDPSNVEDLTGSYGGAMAQHRTRFDKSMVESWGNALRQICCISGLDSSNFNNEAKLVEEIVKQTLRILNEFNQISVDKVKSLFGTLVGMDARFFEVKLLLSDAQDFGKNVCIIGIWGEGGVGKTTLARAIYNQMSSEFGIQHFAENIRENSGKLPTNAVRDEVLSKIFGGSDFNVSSKRVSRKKVILVLDDVSDLNQINSIICYKLHFASGSLIIVTSRDRHLLKNLGAEIYAVKKLNYREALELFCLNAFKRKVPEEGYLELCNRAVEYAQGLPLALVVLGSNLFQRSAPEWEDELGKLRHSFDHNIHKILRISYDGLPYEEKKIFLDIACLFRGRQRDEVEGMLDNQGPKIGISRLADKALISISSGNRIKMHDLIQQMAKEIICEEEKLKKRQWLWNPKDVYIVLSKGIGAARGVSLDMSQVEKLNLNPSTFQSLDNLSYLNFYTSCDMAQLCVPQDFEHLPIKLRYLYFGHYPSTSLQITSKNLVELDMRDSQLKELFIGCKPFFSLKRLNLSRSTNLTIIWNLSMASNLELLILKECSSFRQILYLEHLVHLIELQLCYCSSLESLPDEISNLISLSLLDISHCKKLRGLPQTFGDLISLKEFKAGSSGLEELPESFCNLIKLESLVIEKCVNLHRLPQNLGNLISLKELLARESGIVELPESICSLKACKTLDVRKCVDLHDLPQNIGNLESLQYLQVDESGIKDVPSSINNLGELRKLTFSGCEGLKLPPLTGDFFHLTFIDLGNCHISEFPVGLFSVKSLLDLSLSGNDFENIPESIENLKKLQYIVLYNCKKLKYVPESPNLLRLAGYLDMRECSSLDQGRCSELIHNLVAASDEDRSAYNTIMWYPGTELPELMIQRNNNGSLLSFSFKLLEDVVEHELGFYVCVVLDRERFAVICRGNFMDEGGRKIDLEQNEAYYANFEATIQYSGFEPYYCGSETFVKSSKFAEEFQLLRGSTDLDVIIQSEHVLVEPIHFRSQYFEKDCTFTLEFQFQCLSTDLELVDEDGDYLWSSDGIIKCAVYPLFHHLT